MSSWGFVRAFVGKLSLVSALGVASGCASGLPPTSPTPESAMEVVGPTLDSPYVIRVCVKQPGVPRHKDFWAIDGSGHLVLEDSELALLQRNGQSIYYFDPDANPESTRMLPIPHNTLQCTKPPRSVLSSNGGASSTKVVSAVQPVQKPAAVLTTTTARIAEPAPCTTTSEAGQKRSSRGTTTRTCMRVRVLKAPTRPAPAPVAKSEVESPTLAQAAPEPALTPPSLADWKVGAPNFSVPVLDPQRVLECVGSLCHARHQNFAPKSGKPAANGMRESRSLPPNGGGSGAKAPQTRKPPAGPKSVAKPATNPTITTPQTTTTTVVKGKTPPTKGGARLPPRGTPERRAIETARGKGVDAKKKQEMENIRAGGRGSGVWTDKELADMRKGGNFPEGTNWHHDPTVANRPDLAADPSVVRPVRGGVKGHLEAHGGDWRKP